jgi:hypothetical protein
MSTKKESHTVQKNDYNPASMTAYNAFQPQAQNVLSEYAKPLDTNAFFKTNLQLALGNTQTLGRRNMDNLLLRTNLFNGNAPSGFAQSLLATQTRNNSALDASAWLTAMTQAESDRKWATTNMLGYRPLQTGQTQDSVEKTSGLGTWLPQVVGAGLGIASAFMNPMSAAGAGKTAGGGGGGFGGFAMNNSFLSPGNSLGGWNPSGSTNLSGPIAYKGPF